MYSNLLCQIYSVDAIVSFVTIDERLEALTARHEALTMTVELMSRNQEAALADIHSVHAEMQQDIKILLRSQVLMSESLGNVAGSLDKLTGRVTELAEAQRHTDRRMDALILTVDEIVRGRNGGAKV